MSNNTHHDIVLMVLFFFLIVCIVDDKITDILPYIVGGGLAIFVTNLAEITARPDKTHQKDIMNLKNILKIIFFTPLIGILRGLGNLNKIRIKKIRENRFSDYSLNRHGVKAGVIKSAINEDRNHKDQVLLDIRAREFMIIFVEIFETVHPGRKIYSSDFSDLRKVIDLYFLCPIRIRSRLLHYFDTIPGFVVTPLFSTYQCRPGELNDMVIPEIESMAKSQHLIVANRAISNLT